MIKSKQYINILGLFIFFYYFVVYVITGSLYEEYNQGNFIKISFIILFISLFPYLLKNYRYFLVIFILIFYMILYLIYYYILREDYITVEVIWFQAKVILYAIFNILIAIVFYNNMTDNKFKILILFSTMILSFFVFFNIDYEVLRYTLAYQLVGGILPLFAIFAIFTLDKKILKFFLMTFIAILLFLIQSRASFYAFCVVYLIFLLKEMGFKNFFFIVLFFIVFSFIFLMITNIELDQRMFAITQLNKDGSFNERIEQFKYGFEAIKNNWFFGQYGGQVIYNEGAIYSNGLGSYMHNWLSFWRQFGIIFFIIFTIFYFSRLFMIFELWINNYKYSDFIFYLGLYMSVNILLFHSYNYPYIWFVLTIMHLYLIDSKKYVEK